MIILGVNGWFERSHDASACLIVDGEIIAIAEEERFTRQKYAYDKLPHNAIAFCLNKAKVRVDDLDVVAWGWDMPLLHNVHGRSFDYNEEALNKIIFPPKFYPNRQKQVPVEFVDHHFAHAASVYCCRTSDDPIAIVVLDGGGEEFSVSLFLGVKGKITKIASFPMLASPGFFYEAACEYLGFLRTHAGKVMGLASHGISHGDKGFFNFSEDDLKPCINLQLAKNKTLDWEDEIIGRWLGLFTELWGEPKFTQYKFSSLKGFLQPSLVLGKRERNIAATIQDAFERLYLWYVLQCMKNTGANNLALAGGSALNCSANGMLVELGIAENIFLQPMANDAGTALGAAVTMMDNIPVNFFSSPYLGPNFSTNQLLSLLRKNRIDFIEPSNLYSVAAELIASGKILGWFDGRMEVGPRALGGRSILADPRNIKMHKAVNDVKSRELWRPLAPSILEEYSGEYFTKPISSHYMLVRDYVKPDKRSEIPAVVHIDGSVRPQTVTRDINHNFHSLLENFHLQTGVPLVMNTSFNDESEPIVCSPYDAVRTFFCTGLDALVLGPFLIKK